MTFSDSTATWIYIEVFALGLWLEYTHLYTEVKEWHYHVSFSSVCLDWFVFAACLAEQQNVILSSLPTWGTSQTVNDGECIQTSFPSTVSKLFMKGLIRSQNSGLATTGSNTQGPSMTSPVYTDWPKCSDSFHLISLAHFCLRARTRPWARVPPFETAVPHSTGHTS